MTWLLLLFLLLLQQQQLVTVLDVKEDSSDVETESTSCSKGPNQHEYAVRFWYFESIET
jgi:hypothetical protein